MITQVKMGNFEIPVIDVEGRRYVAIQQVCGVLGIDKSSQGKRLRGLPWANVEKMRVGGVGHPRVVIPLGVLPLWLDAIYVNMIAEHARPRLAELKEAAEAYLSARPGTALAVVEPPAPTPVEHEVVEPKPEPEPAAINAGTGLAVFQFDSNPIRVRTIKGEPWWVAKDVCDVLGIGTVTQAVNGRSDREGDGLDDDESRMDIVHTGNGPREMILINESGLYSLIFKSRKPDARRFRRWVTSEVLPSIRRTGSYSVAPTPMVNDPIESLLTATLATHRAISQLNVDHHIFAAEVYARFAAVESDLSRFKQAALEAPLTHMTVRAFAATKGLKLDNEQLQAFGRRAAKIGRERGDEPHRIEDERWGSVLSHRIEILEGLLPEFIGESSVAA